MPIYWVRLRFSSMGLDLSCYVGMKGRHMPVQRPEPAM
ncbi:hypothetical protein SXCC_04727 [Gluconacetobacter sp. SXCC-1]|nr:hypothetical protein SXCC_04727 [Gluconacetobacter sp. SXCC-1]